MSPPILPEWWLGQLLHAVGSDWHTDKRLVLRIDPPDGLEALIYGKRLLRTWLSELLPGEPIKIRTRHDLVIDDLTIVEQWTTEPDRGRVQSRYVQLTEELFPGCHWVAGVAAGGCDCYGDGGKGLPWPLIACQGNEPVAVLCPISPPRELEP
jgi:hypothetical protein